MRTRMHDSIEVEIQIVHLFAIWVGLSGVNGDGDAINFLGLFLNYGVYDLGILLGKPAEERWNTHGVGLVSIRQWNCSHSKRKIRRQRQRKGSGTASAVCLMPRNNVKLVQISAAMRTVKLRMCARKKKSFKW
jgi:hypothetical protein